MNTQASTFLETTITGMSQEGRGIAHIQNKVTFIEGALPGETVRFHYTHRRANFDEGAVDEILVASPARVTPRCMHFDICGGCSLQHLDAEAQIQYKEQQLLNDLKHAHITGFSLLKPLQSDAFGYRHKARLGVKYVPKKQKVVVGFREKQTNLIGDLKRCEVLHPSVGPLLGAFSELIGTTDLKAKTAQLEIAIDDKTAAVIIRHLEPMGESDRAKWIAFAKQHDLRLYVQPKGLESVVLLSPEAVRHCEEDVVRRGNPGCSSGSPRCARDDNGVVDSLLEYAIPLENLRMQFFPTQFTQVNPTLNRQMIAQAMQLLDIQKTDHVLDLFCGIGNFSLPMACRAAQVVGVEGESGSVSQAKKNAELNGIANADFHVANLFEDIKDLSWARTTYDKILLDPPRAGAKEILPMFAIWKPKKVVYVSCSPTTFVRDAALLQKLGYALRSVGVMDMFPQTEHVEVMGLFEAAG